MISGVDEVVDPAARGQLQRLEQIAGNKTDLRCLESCVSEGPSAVSASR